MATSTETIAYLGIGSNMGEREDQIESAIGYLDRLPETQVLRRSPIYESKPWGKSDQSDFLNMVAEVSTKLPPHTLLRHCKSIEKRMGREEAEEQWGPRPIDIDILLFGDRRVRTATLVLPHAHMWERHFVLRPLADLLPNLTAPDGTPIEQMLQKEEIASQSVSAYDTRKTEDEGSS